MAPGPLIHSCWLCTSKVFEDGRRRAKYTDSHSVLIVEIVERETVVNCFAIIESTIHIRTHAHGHTYTDIHRTQLYIRLVKNTNHMHANKSTHAHIPEDLITLIGFRTFLDKDIL